MTYTQLASAASFVTDLQEKDSQVLRLAVYAIAKVFNVPDDVAEDAAELLLAQRGFLV